MLFCCLWFVCDYLRDLRETYGGRLWELIEYSCVNILSQIAQITQTNAASCIISQRKTVWLMLFCGLSAIICVICGRYWSFFCADRLSTLACYSLADNADHADEYSKLYYFAEKDRLFEVKAVLGFVCDYLRETYCFLCAICLSPLTCLFSRR